MKPKHPNIAIDIGNSFSKVGIFDGEELTAQHVIARPEELHSLLKNFSGSNVIISSVNRDQSTLFDRLAFRQLVYLSTSTEIPVKVQYKTPETLGVDRIAAVCGAFHEFPGKNSLVIDAGTCVTYELLNASGVYLGGAISPGMSMRFRAMNTFTARLPLVEPVDTPMSIGNSTASCMQTGVVRGLIHELQGAIDTYSSQFENLQVILTGGDSRFFENKLKGSIFAIPELVLKGLNKILLHNIRD